MKKMLVLSVVVFFVAMLTSCSTNKPLKATEVKPLDLNWECLGAVGGNERGSFNVFKFDIDSVTYIVCSEYNGGMTLIDKFKK